MFNPWFREEEEILKRGRTIRDSYESGEFYRDYLITEITRLMNELREEDPDIIMKVYVSHGDIQEDIFGNSFVDALDCSFGFNYKEDVK